MSRDKASIHLSLWGIALVLAAGCIAWAWAPFRWLGFAGLLVAAIGYAIMPKDMCKSDDACPVCGADTWT